MAPSRRRGRPMVAVRPIRQAVAPPARVPQVVAPRPIPLLLPLNIVWSLPGPAIACAVDSAFGFSPRTTPVLPAPSCRKPRIAGFSRLHYSTNKEALVRTCYTGQVCREHHGQTVTLFGWVHLRRDH